MTKRHVCSMLALLLAAACDKKTAETTEAKSDPPPTAIKSAPAPAPTASAAASSAPAPAPAPPAESDVKVNPEVKKLIADVVANCKVDADGGNVSDCKNGEADKFAAYVQDKQPEDYYVSVAEIALTDGAKDKNTFGAALAAVGNVGWGSGKEWLQKNATPAAAKRFLKLDEIVTDGQSFGFSTMGAAIPLLAGQADALTAVLAKRASGSLKTGILVYYVKFGGVAVLPTLDKIAKEDKDPAVRGAAVWSPGVALASSWNSSQASFALADADKPKVCDFARQYVEDAEPQVANQAASSMGRCKGAYIDAALATLEKRAAKEPFADGLASALKDQCWAESSIDPVNGTADQCKKDVAIIEKASARADLTPEQLRMALWAMKTVGKYGCGKGYGSGPGQAPDCVKHVQQVFAKFTKHKEKVVAEEAQNDLKDLQ